MGWSSQNKHPGFSVQAGGQQEDSTVWTSSLPLCLWAGHIRTKLPVVTSEVKSKGLVFTSLRHLSGECPDTEWFPENVKQKQTKIGVAILEMR